MTRFADNEPPSEVAKRVTTATVRAMAEKPDLEVAWATGRPGGEAGRPRLPRPTDQLDPQDVIFLRGAADTAALRQKFHDSRTHRRHRPLGQEAQQVYEALEQARVEALGAERYPGAAANIAAEMDLRYRGEGFHKAERRDDIPMGVAMRLLAREKLGGLDTPPGGARAAEFWRPWVDERVDADAWDALRRDRWDPDAFGRASRRVLEALGLVEQEEPEEQEDEQAPGGDDNQDEDEQQQQQQTRAGDQEQQEEPEEDQTQQEESEQPAGVQEAGERSSDEESGGGAHEEAPAGPAGVREESAETEVPAGFRYHVYTSQHDEVVDAANLVDAAELNRLRAQLDGQLTNLHNVVARVANRLQRRLMARQTRAWQFDLEEGLLDAGRLARVVADPSNPLSFKWETESDFRDTVVTLLVDNSGSMRGRPITVAAMSADILARTLERCGVKVEVLGFTTRAWKGGESRKEWMNNGKPANPGRLNDLRHIIYKAADSPYRRSRRNLGLMLREGILKENVDGEALDWAHQRLLARREQRRILMVISDGAPVDDSTLSVNPGNYLERHLREVIEGIETRSPVELTAIGIGHDVTRYYRRAVTIHDAEDLGGTMLQQLAALFDEDRGGPRRGRRAA